MMRMRVALFTLCAILGLAAGADNETVAQVQAMMPASAYVYNPIQSNNLITSAGGTSTPRQLEQWPALADQGISQTSFVMNGCAIRPPHVHPRAAGLLYAIQAANLSVGFISEAGQLVQNYIQSGASTLFPQGLVHYQQNADCNPAYYTISYGASDPGTQVTAPAFEKLPSAVAASSLGLDATTYQNVVNSLPKPAFIPNSDPDCVARCQAAGKNVLAPAAALMPNIANAGR